jgi:hypothetical protein
MEGSMTTPDIAGLGEHLSNETEARLRAEVERNTAPFRTLERQAAEIERLRRALWPFAQVKPTAGRGFVNICALNVDVIAARAALTTGEEK